MASYNSTRGNCKGFLPVPVLNDENARNNERTPLLSVPDNILCQGSAGVLIEAPPPRSWSGEPESCLVNEETRPLPVLSKFTSNTPLGMEAKAIPATANSPDGNGDLQLPTSVDDSLILTIIRQGTDEENQRNFHGGVTQGQFWIIFSGILVGIFIAAFDSTIMASTHSTITSAFHSSELASWLSTSFLLTSTGFQPLYGRISDVVGRRLPYVFACFIFTAATLWCAMAQSMSSLVAARAVCGLGAGGMTSMGSILLSDILPIEVRGRYQSIYNLGWGVGSVLGAASGGFLADVLGWRWEFGIQVPFGVFCMAILYFTIPNSGDDNPCYFFDIHERFKNFDFKGSIFLTTSITFLILCMNLGGNVLEWTDWRILGSLTLSLILGNFLIRAEAQAKFPVMPLKLLYSSPRGLMVFNNFFCAMTINAILFNLPLYFQAVLLESATQASTRLLVPAVACTIAGVCAGFIIDHTGATRPTLYCGSALLIIGSVLLFFMNRELPSWSYFLFLIPSNLGIGFSFPSSLMTMLSTSLQADQAVAISTLVMWRSLGGVFGVASSSLIVQNCLLHFLTENITGPNKAEVIEKVRKSVTSIYTLDKMHQQQAIISYETSLRYCFGWSIITCLVAFALIARVKVPNIKSKSRAKVTEYEAIRE